MHSREQQKVFEWTNHEFDRLYEEQYRRHSEIHWTPIEIAIAALDLLDVKKGTHVLDIGSGVGKFCTVGALASYANFTGVEKRQDLIEVAKNLNEKFNITNAEFIHSNIKEIDFQNFDSFYYYNPFCEHLSISNVIDDSVSFSREKHREYEDYVIDQFQNSPINTRVVTYCSEQFTFPETYELKELMFEGKLALWVKVK